MSSFSSRMQFVLRTAAWVSRYLEFAQFGRTTRPTDLLTHLQADPQRNSCALELDCFAYMHAYLKSKKCVHIYKHTIYICKYVYTSMYVYMFMSIYIYKYVCVYIYTHACSPYLSRSP